MCGIFCWKYRHRLFPGKVKLCNSGALLCFPKWYAENEINICRNKFWTIEIWSNCSTWEYCGICSFHCLLFKVRTCSGRLARDYCNLHGEDMRNYTVYSTFTCILTVSTYCTIAVRITGTHHTVYLYTVILTYCTITLFTSSNLFAICTAGWMLIAFHCHCICTLTVMIQLALTSPYSVGSFGLNSQKKTSLHTCGGCSVLLCECREVYKPLDRNLYYVECILVSLIFTLLTLSVPSWLALAWLVSSVSHYIR